MPCILGLSWLVFTSPCWHLLQWMMLHQNPGWKPQAVSPFAGAAYPGLRTSWALPFSSLSPHCCMPLACFPGARWQNNSKGLGHLSVPTMENAPNSLYLITHPPTWAKCPPHRIANHKSSQFCFAHQLSGSLFWVRVRGRTPQRLIRSHRFLCQTQG